MPVISSSWDRRVKTKHRLQWKIQDRYGSSLGAGGRVPVLTNPHFAQNVDRNSRFLCLTTALLSFHTWETHLQDASHSLLVLIHTDDVNFLLFLHSHFVVAQVVEVCLQVLKMSSLQKHLWVLV